MITISRCITVNTSINSGENIMKKSGTFPIMKSYDLNI